MDYKWRVMNITKMVKLMLLVALVCSCQHSTKTEKAHFQFPQGVASADPQPNAIMLWTRVVDANANPESINLSVEVSESPAFSAITVSERITAYKNDDYTIRYYARELVPNKKYYYRFISGSDTSRVGRTFTAPEDPNPKLNKLRLFFIWEISFTRSWVTIPDTIITIQTG